MQGLQNHAPHSRSPQLYPKSVLLSLKYEGLLILTSVRCFAFRDDTLNYGATIQTELTARDHGVESVVGLDVEYEAAEAVVEEGDVFCFAEAFVVVWGVTAAL